MDKLGFPAALLRFEQKLAHEEGTPSIGRGLSYDQVAEMKIRPSNTWRLLPRATNYGIFYAKL